MPHNPHPETHPAPHGPNVLPDHSEASGELPTIASTRYEQIAQRVCRQLLMSEPGYQASFCFGTPGGNDLDLRLCFADLGAISEESIRQRLLSELREAGADIEVDLLFMSSQEFDEGIRDLVELGDVTERLHDGFDPHTQQAAVGDTSLFSLYIFSTMRLLDLNPQAGSYGSPQGALDRLVLTSDGALGWMHFYTGCFLHQYLHRLREPEALTTYQNHVAKFLGRVATGSPLAMLDLPSLADIKPELIAAIRAADARNSTDATMLSVVMGHPHTAAMFDPESQRLLIAAGQIRSGQTTAAPPDFTPAGEAMLFYYAFRHGGHRRPESGEEADPLMSYALGELVQDLGRPVTYPAGSTLMVQGDQATDIIYIPLKTADGRDNAAADITVHNAHGKTVAQYVRKPGKVVGEGAVFGFPSSATVTAQQELEAYAIDAHTIRALLTNPDVRQQLKQQLISTREARRMDVLLRYFAREAAVFARQTLPYTSLGGRQAATNALGENPLAGYNLGQRFHDMLRLFAQSPDHDEVTILTTGEETETLFEMGRVIEHLYVVSTGTVEILLKNGETVTLHPGEYFGESSLLGLETTGTARLSPESSAIAADTRWFTYFTQFRQPIRQVEVPDQLRDILPVHLLYHLAAEGYDRVRRRLITQKH